MQAPETQQQQLQLQRPSTATLKKYGLDVDDWDRYASKQGGVCAVCRQLTKTGRLCIDHEHVRGWKKMVSAQRKLFVRGLLCWRCNTTFVGRGITVDRSRNVTAYLEEFESRRPPPVEKPKKSTVGIPAPPTT